MRARALVASAAALLALAGCASSTPEPESTPSPTVSATPGLTGELTVFAAASLQGAFDAMTAEFAEQNPGVTVNPVTYDGSSTLATQLVGGASADVFASADQKNMTTVTDAGVAQGTPTVFTTNTLEIVVAPGNPKNITSLADLAALSTSGGTVVICAPEVPCGSAARKVIDRAGLTFSIASNEQNVKAVLAKVQSGDADAGIVYRTDVLAAGDTVQGVEFPEAAGVVNEYPIAVLAEPTRTHGEDVAQAFVDLVLSDQGQKILTDLGFTAP
jgi:molybdate transport system substrate-binding protein